MAGRLFDRAFNRAAAANVDEDAERPLKPRTDSIRPEAGAAATAATPMQISDAIQRVLLADKDKDYFRYMPQVCKQLLVSRFLHSATLLSCHTPVDEVRFADVQTHGTASA